MPFVPHSLVICSVPHSGSVPEPEPEPELEPEPEPGPEPGPGPGLEPVGARGLARPLGLEQEEPKEQDSSMTQSSGL